MSLRRPAAEFSPSAFINIPSSFLAPAPLQQAASPTPTHSRTPYTTKAVASAPARPGRPTSTPRAFEPSAGSSMKSSPGYPASGGNIAQARSALFQTAKSNSEMDASVRAYYREVGLYDILSDDQVIRCAKQIRTLSWYEEMQETLNARLGREPTEVEWALACLREVEKQPDEPVDVESFRETLRRGRMAKDSLISANLRLVVCIARKYSNNGVSLSDLIQEGSLGLIRGAERFDHTKGFRFATYASWWIRQSIQRAISDTSRIIRLPAGVGDISKRVARARKMLHNQLMREPTQEELAEELGVTRARLEFIVKRAAETNTISLHTPVSSSFDNSATIGDMIETPAATPEEAVTKDLLRGDLETVLLNLSPREREVVRLRYGFDDGKTKNYDEIGSLYCVPGERIRQIERRAMRKLKHPSLNSCLRDYVR